MDALFTSAVARYRARVLGVLLAGRGNDGADGLLRIREAGGFTLAQDEASSVVWGMPQEAVKRNAAHLVLPLEAIVPALIAPLAAR